MIIVLGSQCRRAPLEIQELDDETWEKRELRMRVLAPLVAAERTTAGAVDAAARELGSSGSSVPNAIVSFGSSVLAAHLPL
jgi:hypothetical protein